MEGLLGKEEDFVCYAGLDRQPVEVDEGGSDVLPRLCVCELALFFKQTTAQSHDFKASPLS